MNKGGGGHELGFKTFHNLSGLNSAPQIASSAQHLCEFIYRLEARGILIGPPCSEPSPLKRPLRNDSRSPIDPAGEAGWGDCGRAPLLFMGVHEPCDCSAQLSEPVGRCWLDACPGSEHVTYLVFKSRPSLLSLRVISPTAPSNQFKVSE
jgi:hypothetical protein